MRHPEENRQMSMVRGAGNKNIYRSLDKIRIVDNAL